MAGNVRFELSSASPDEIGFTGTYSNGKRGSYPTALLDRSGSFREGSESRFLSSGASTPRPTASPSSDVPLLTQCLLLEPVAPVDQKYTRAGELRRLLGISLGSSAEDNAFGAAYSKPLPPVATEDLKRFRASVLDTSLKARGRIKRFSDSLMRLHRYESLNPKKLQRNEMMLSERSGGPNLLKVGIQVQRNPSDLGTQRLEDRTKNIVLNKRVRTAVAESRADGRSNTILRQPMVMGKDREIFRDASESSDHAEEKVRKLPAGGEGWDRKMKRKRTMGTFFARPIENDGVVKRVMHHKLNSETVQQSCDAQGLRLGSVNGAGDINSLDGSSSPASSSARTFSRNEPDKISSTRDFACVNKERLVAKANNKVNIVEENHIISPSQSPVIKGKASRGPRTSSVTAVNSSPNFPRASVAIDGWEQPQGVKVNSVGAPNNRKRQIQTGSASPSPPVAQWVGQRPQKSSRTRRSNVVSPISNHDDVQMSSEGGDVSEFPSRVTSAAISGPLLSKGAANGTTQVRVKHENVSSPAILSESEESGAGENREGKPKEKGTIDYGVEEKPRIQNIVPSILVAKKNKMVNKEETGDGVRRQGRTGRVSSSSRASMSPVREKVENPSSVKPLRSTRPGSEKSGSKSGRPPLKKFSDRKGFTRLGQTPTSGSPDFAESDDDREELLAAANSACHSSYFFCSSPFWKKMELVFTPTFPEDLSFLKQQLKSVEERRESLPSVFGQGNDSDFLICEDKFQSQLVSRENERSLMDQVQMNKFVQDVDLLDQGHDHGSFRGNLKEIKRVTPLYQRVLSALIVEDEFEEFEEINGGRNISFQYGRDDSPNDIHLPMDFECENKDGTGLSYNSMLGFQNQSQSSDGFLCNGSTTMSRTGGFHRHLCNDEVNKGGYGFMPAKMEMFPANSGSINGNPATHEIASSIPVLDCQYEHLSLDDRLLRELQSIGLCLETVPDLADEEEGAIDHDLLELQKGLDQQVGKMKAHFKKIIKAVEEGKEKEERSLEQVAMNRLVELAYKKQLATRGSSASKLGVPKVPKQVALAFTKRTLARCRKFEDTDKSCFSEPSLRDVIYAAPPRGDVAEPVSCIQESRASGGRTRRQDLNDGRFGSGKSNAFASILHPCDQDFAKTGPILNRGKKKEVLLEDVSGNASLRGTPLLGNTLLGGAKGKRSERDAMGRNSVIKAGRASQNRSKGDNKPKAKPKQKTGQLSTPADGAVNKYRETGSNKRGETGVTSHGYNPLDTTFKERRETQNSTDLPELDSMEFGGHQDLGSLFDGIPESDLAGLEIPMDCLELPMDGLEIPMDDLSELNMF